ncbi:MAG: hypothetical protein CMO80_13290 [Verrucomicrobiales bacterium]|nr:hypothetical protein [Verrucomicrobiales bacterium]|tara:strand:+ start:3635 stop:3937 length:303 start_codon:yes stop_codon:yes gene_type:complete
MTRMNHFLYSTIHVSDRELNTYLWSDGLNEESMDLSGLSNCGCHLDLIGSGSDEDIQNQHKYYAGPNERADWMSEFPDSETPAHVDPPYDRDRHLPKRDC